MTRKLKVGLTLAGSFLTLIGGVFGVKALTQPGRGAAQTMATASEKDKESPKAKSVEEPKILPKLIPETPNTVSAPTKPEVKPVNLTLDEPAANTPTPKTVKVIPALGELDPVVTVKPNEEQKENSPKTLPDSIRDSNLRRVQALDPIPLEPVEKKEPKKEEKKGISSIDPIGELPHVKKNLDPVSSEPKKPIVSEINLELDPPPSANNIRLTPTKKEEPKVIEPVPTPEPITFNPLKKEEPKSVQNLDPVRPARTEIKIEDPPELTPKRTEPKSVIGGIETPPASKQSGIGNRESGIGNRESGIGTISVQNAVPEKPSKPAEIPTIRIQSEPLPTEEAITRVSDTKIENYDEDIHRVSRNQQYASDKEMYKAISRQYYENDTYAAALQLYNAERPTRIPGAVRVPPIEVLAKTAPTYMPKPVTRTPVQPVSATTPTPEATPAKFEAPPNQVGYTVAPSGETLREIAQKKFGSPDMWSAIKALNPSVNADERIPGGTRLFLPAR